MISFMVRTGFRAAQFDRYDHARRCSRFEINLKSYVVRAGSPLSRGSPMVSFRVLDEPSVHSQPRSLCPTA
ncbi:hypothetical protein RGR602_PA00023 (plasmid) [Rhizobium gallicum bv. gallicum R602sp]|uniref:Uncharacterized protein n=1 Tax=Rhizobium gallicum bv. gallicum R602sp TaxID=1041138 RepID=A0A0B4X9H6_9HYPH|nr:hypothetical protein RGR602_PA00023 [Rhizobium gallicum bv. gallicum R602sp]